MEIIKSSRGSEKILKDGYSYTRKKSSKTSISWECSKRKSASCKGSIKTDLAKTHVIASTPHSHASDSFATEAMKVREDIKIRALSQPGNPGQIISDTIAKYSVRVRVRVAAEKSDSLKKLVRRIKRGNKLSEPANITDRHVPELTEELISSIGADD